MLAPLRGLKDLSADYSPSPRRAKINIVPIMLVHCIQANPQHSGDLLMRRSDRHKQADLISQFRARVLLAFFRSRHDVPPQSR